MYVGDQRAVEARHTVAERLLAQVHTGIDDDTALHDAVAPLHENRAPQTAVALIAREADAAATTDTRYTATRP